VWITQGRGSRAPCSAQDANFRSRVEMLHLFRDDSLAPPADENNQYQTICSLGYSNATPRQVVCSKIIHNMYGRLSA
jgi:hypothetical protein